MSKFADQLVKKLKEQYVNIPYSDSMYSYCLTHTYDPEGRRRYVAAPYEPEVFEAICAFIQFESSELEETYSMDQVEVIEILEVFYGCQKIKRSKAYQVDLYENWELFCGSGVQEVEYLKRDGMDEYFKRYIESFYKDNPEWRPNVV